MDYRRVYMNLILSRQLMGRKKRKNTHSDYIYYENHHILPQCFGGTNDPENLVLLTAKEHFISHLLLIKCYEDSEMKSSMQRAITMMCLNGDCTKRILSASQYALARKMSNGLKFTEKHRQNLSAATKGVPKSEKHKEALSKAHKGKPNPNKGKKQAPELFEIYSKARKGLKRSEAIKQAMSEQRKKSVYQYDLQMNLIKIWSSVREAQIGMKTIKGKAAIGICANSKCKTSLGFIWRWYNINENNGNS